MEMLEKVYVVRFREFIKGEESAGCGNFENCFATEDKAFEAMTTDMNYKTDELAADGLEPKNDHTADYAEVECKNGDKYEWWIDCLPIFERVGMG